VGTNGAFPLTAAFSLSLRISSVLGGDKQGRESMMQKIKSPELAIMV
jgi:hypothetical protein